jgi:hypothetical protein
VIAHGWHPMRKQPLSFWPLVGYRLAGRAVVRNWVICASPYVLAWRVVRSALAARRPRPRCVRSRGPRPASQPARAGLERSARRRCRCLVGARQARGDAFGFALGVGLHVILGHVGAVTVFFAPGNVAAVALISRQTRAAGRRFNYRVGA